MMKFLKKLLKFVLVKEEKSKNNLDQLNINTISLLELSNIDPDIRAENIDIEGFCKNFKQL